MVSNAQEAVVLEGLTKRYGDLLAVDNISLSVKQGEVFAFLGPNGAGKTTAVEIIETIRKPTSGRVSVLGMDITRQRSAIIPRIGVLPQGFNSFDRLTVYESIQYFARLFGRPNADIAGLIALVALQDKQSVQFTNLSGGLKQRLGIAIALVNDPEVVFLDEPTTGLDPHARREVWQVLMGLKKQGKTVFLTTHYIEEAELLANTVAIISKGKIVAIGSPDELIERTIPDLALTLKSVDARAVEIIRKLGFAPRQDQDGNLRVRLGSGDDVAKVLAALTAAGVSLPRLDVRKPNLEEVYLKLTGQPLHEDSLRQGDFA